MRRTTLQARKSLQPQPQRRKLPTTTLPPRQQKPLLKTSKKPCPLCKQLFQNVGLHTPHCPENRVECEDCKALVQAAELVLALSALPRLLRACPQPVPHPVPQGVQPPGRARPLRADRAPAFPITLALK
jgi:hypothetical protein